MGSGGMGGLGTARYFMHKEGQRIAAARRRQARRRAKNLRRRQVSAQQLMRERIDEAEGDLGRMLLLAMAVNRLLVRKNALTRKQIAAAADKLTASAAHENRGEL